MHNRAKPRWPTRRSVSSTSSLPASATATRNATRRARAARSSRETPGGLAGRHETVRIEAKTRAPRRVRDAGGVLNRLFRLLLIYMLRALKFGLVVLGFALV